MSRLSESAVIVALIESKNYGSAGIQADAINMGKLHSVSVLINFGALTGNSILTGVCERRARSDDHGDRLQLPAVGGRLQGVTRRSVRRCHRRRRDRADADRGHLREQVHRRRVRRRRLHRRQALADAEHRRDRVRDECGGRGHRQSAVPGTPDPVGPVTGRCDSVPWPARMPAMFATTACRPAWRRSAQARRHASRTTSRSRRRRRRQRPETSMRPARSARSPRARE
jgi:hypothetical protein